MIRHRAFPLMWQLSLHVLICLRTGHAEVSCGNHNASTCESCPDGYVPDIHPWDFCNGDCQWFEDACLHLKDARLEGTGGFPIPPDTRPPGCSRVTEDLSNHKVSIIIPFLNENIDHMKSTMRALLFYTPDELVEEFIWISDGNADARERQLTAMSSKVVVRALPTRVGLMQAKMLGAALAKAPVLVFMEAHCIVNKEWLEPLLQRIVLNPKTLAMPTLDKVPAGNWKQYKRSAPGHWRFEWNLNIIYTNPGNLLSMLQHPKEPIASPGTSGGVLAIRKDWFLTLDLFDPGLQQWGGDHVELSLKTWRCGGCIEIIPCSRVGHLFREPQQRPYQVQVNQVARNYARLARVWMKDHLSAFELVKLETKDMQFDDLGKMHDRRDKLACKDMAWYLENVDAEMAWELPRLCSSEAPDGHLKKCKNLAEGRGTINASSVMPPLEFRKAVLARKAREAEATRAAQSDGDASHAEL